MILSSGIKNNLNLSQHYSIEDSIPIVELNDSGFLRSINNRYTKSFRLTDINYKLNDKDEQRRILDNYKTMLNSLDETSEYAFTVFNTKLSDTYMEDNIYYKHNSDGLDKYRDAANEIIKMNIIDDKKAYSKEKIISISLEAATYEKALKNMKVLNEVLHTGIEDIDGAKLTEMTATDILKYLNSIYNIKKKNTYSEKAKLGRRDVEIFTLRNAIRQGISAKELVQPSSMYVSTDYIQFGDTYLRAFYLDNVNKQIDTECIDKICSVDFNLLLTCKLKQMDIDKAIKLAKDELLNVEGDIFNNQRKLSEAGVSTDLVPRDMQQRRDEALDANDSINIRDEKFFDLSLYTLIFADNLQELNDNSEKFKKLAKGKGLYFVTGYNLQENIFNSCLPYGINQTTFSRSIDTEGSVAFIPFSCQDLMQSNGDFYGKNKLTHNPITYNLMSGDNYSSIILGESGKGKSFKAKEIILGRRLRNAYRDTIIIDPNDEWGKLIKELGGQEIMIEAGGENHINLFDIDAWYGDNPLADKEDFIISVTKQMLHSYTGLSAGQMTTAAAAIHEIYQGWSRTHKDEDVPTIKEYYQALKKIAEESRNREDEELCKAIKYYCGEYENTLFSQKTDIDVTKSIVSYNLKNLGTTLKPLAMQIIMDNIWTKVCKNRYRGIPTDLIIDEFHLMFNGEAETAIWMAKFWKMFRKYLGCPIGITQNPEDMLKSEEGRGVLYNTSLDILLSLKKKDREIIQDVLTLTSEQLKYIKNQPAGEGIIYIQASKSIGDNNIVIPFKNPYKKDNAIYDLINTTSYKNK